MNRFSEQLARVPVDPGVYIMRGAEGQVIYVGKAANLRSRVRSYFGSPLSMEGKTRALSESIADFEYVVTHTEQEALHLEAALVKRHQPIVNVRLKDDKHYPYVKVDLADPWPRVYITRRVEKDGGRYFGPFANAGSVRRPRDVASRKPADEDICGLARGEAEAVVQVLFVRGTRMVGVDNFTLDGTRDVPESEVMASFVKQFYESATYVPKRVIVPVELPEQELIESFLGDRRGTKVEVLVPQRGEKKRLVEMAAKNAHEAMDMAHVKWLADRGKTHAALQGLQDELDLAALPKRIECYDISNTQGTSSVGSMVVFVDGHPRPQEYRRFRIKSVEGANDFASMAEVLRRRFARARARLLEDTGAKAPELNGAHRNGGR